MRVTRRLILQKARHQATGKPATPSDCLWARGFRYYFTPLTGVLFTFPSRYSFTIGQSVIFSLTGWSPQIPAGLHVSCGTRVPARVWSIFNYRAVTVSGRPFHAVHLTPLAHVAGPTTP